MLGILITGVATATYGGHSTCQLGAWAPCTNIDWAHGSTSRIPSGLDRDLDPWTWASLPILGGAGYVINLKNGFIAGVRLSPPTVDPRIFHQNRRHADELDSDDTSIPDPVSTHTYWP